MTLFESSAAVKYYLLRKNKKHFRKYGVHPINCRRLKQGQFHTTYKELREYPDRFFQYLRMLPETFDYILQIVSPHLRKNWTNIHSRPIQAEERLVVTLRLVYSNKLATH